MSITTQAVSNKCRHQPLLAAVICMDGTVCICGLDVCHVMHVTTLRGPRRELLLLSVTAL